MREVYFFCYSRYTIMTAYFISQTVHIGDRCTLIVSDQISNENGIISHVTNTGLWDEVVEFKESNKTPDDIYKEVERFIKSHKIDYFYISHIMRYASHSFTQKLADNTIINMFDEGTSSVDIVSEYEEWKNKITLKNLVDFRFDRISKYYVLFSQITKPFCHVKIEQIQLGLFIKDERIIENISLMFNYQPEKRIRNFLIVDGGLADLRNVSYEYEKYCTQKIINILGCENVSVKVKPSEKVENIREKYNDDGVEILSNGLVPFEVQYLLSLNNKTYPHCVIAFPTTLIWNMMLINREYGVEDLRFVLLARIVASNYINKNVGESMLKKIEAYKTCFESNELYLPETWEELSDIIGEMRNYI